MVAFAQARREQAHLVVVLLDVVEAALLPEQPPVRRLVLGVVPVGEVARRRGEPRFDRLEARRQRIDDRDVAPLLGQVERSVTRIRSPAL